MRIIVHLKFLFLVILFSSISSLVKSETPSHCSELYGCQVDDPQEEIIKQRLINLGITDPDECMYKISGRCDALRGPRSHCTRLYGCQTEEFLSKDQTPTKNINQTKNNLLTKKLDLNILKEACESIGFTPKTEPFGNCVLKLSERSDLMVTKLDKNVIESKNKGIQYVHKCSANTIESGQCYNYSCEHDTYMKDSYNSYRWNCLGLNPIFDQNYKKPVVSQSVRRKDSSSYNILEDLLSAGLIIGGAYLLGNALSSPSTAITPSPSIINKIQPSNSLIYGPYDTPFGY